MPNKAPPGYQDIHLRFDQERWEQVVAKKKELGLPSFQELFRRLWDLAGPKLKRKF